MGTAVEDGIITKNPCVIKGAGIERAPERPIATIAQVFALADAIDPRYRLALLLATFGGLRLGELLGLTEECSISKPELWRWSSSFRRSPEAGTSQVHGRVMLAGEP